MIERHPKTILVLGMHRSGTSMLGGILNALGISPGDRNRLFSNQYNEKGYFENLEIIRCNEKILADQVNRSLANIHDSESFIDKDSLDGFGWLFGAWVTQQVSQQTDEIHANLIKDTLLDYNSGASGERLRFIKDPRISLTFANWSKAIAFDAAVVMIRNPESVAKSLFSRNHIIDSIGYDLWQLYTYKALLNVQNIPYLLVDYDTFLNEQRDSLHRLFDFLKVTIGFEPGKKNEDAAYRSIDRRLNHKNNDFVSTGVPEDVIDIYRMIRRGKIDDLEDEFKRRMTQLSKGWMAALYVAEKNKRIRYTSKYKEVIERLNRHFLVGKILSALRFIKNDQTFGSQLDL